MKRALFVLGLAVVLGTPAMAQDTTTTTTKTSLGLDFSMPYSLRSEGQTTKERGNLNLGVDGRYWTTENWNIGARFSYDVEQRFSGADRSIWLAPGVQYHWTPSETWTPYVRADLPFRMNNEADIGISAGLGLAWNIGKSIGVENMSIRYDFDFAYMFGMNDAANDLGLEFFKIGFDYRW